MPRSPPPAPSPAADKFTHSAQGIGSQVREASKLADEASAAAQEARANVDRLRESSAAIGNVVDLIAQIARQTTLLALNSTIEAARAGAAGKGLPPSPPRSRRWRCRPRTPPRRSPERSTHSRATPQAPRTRCTGSRWRSRRSARCSTPSMARWPSRTPPPARSPATRPRIAIHHLGRRKRGRDRHRDQAGRDPWRERRQRRQGRDDLRPEAEIALRGAAAPERARDQRKTERLPCHLKFNPARGMMRRSTRSRSTAS